MAKIVHKEEMASILKTIIGASPKVLPTTLNKGDVVRYNNYLYQYIGENEKTVNLLEENSFKKMGLRYRKSEYKIRLINDMEELYRLMYEKGLNGDKQKGNWNNDNACRYYLEILESTKFKTENFESFANIMPSKNINDLFNFPININGDHYYLKDFKNGVYSPEFFFFIRPGYMKENLITDVIKKELKALKIFLNKENKSYREYRNLKLDLSNIKYEDVSKNYKVSYLLNNNKYKNYFTNILNENKDCNFGVYQATETRTYDIDENLKTERPKYFLWIEQKQQKVEDLNRSYFKNLYELNLNYNNIKHNSAPHEIDFWIPNFAEILSGDINNSSAKKNNETHNKYGVFFELKKDGTYKIKFNVVFSTKDQHDDFWYDNSYGVRYAYYLNDDYVRNPSVSYCKWRSEKHPIEITFEVFNNKLQNMEIHGDFDKREIDFFGDEFLRVGSTFIDGTLFLKVFWAIWSYDDAGEWNEWQFAHIVAPFDVKYTSVISPKKEEPTNEEETTNEEENEEENNEQEEREEELKPPPIDDHYEPPIKEERDDYE